MRAARALLGIDQQTLADRAGVSLPTIQRMEASEGKRRRYAHEGGRGLRRGGHELISENMPSLGQGGGVRFKERLPAMASAPAPRARTQEEELADAHLTF
jgi:hypothetical protein